MHLLDYLNPEGPPTALFEIAPPNCEEAGHSWVDAGGGLLICAVCEAEKWADDASTETHETPERS